MPWLRSRTERSSGITTWSVEWREGGRHGKVRSRSLGPVTKKEAEYELAAMEAGKATRREKRTVEARRAVEDYLRHLKASGRRDGTIEHDADKLNPLLDAWADTPLSNWSRTMLEGFLNDREWAPYRVRNALGVYRRFVRWCDAVGYVCGDFVAGFKPPRARPANEREALTAEQCRRLLEAARGHYLEVPVALGLFAGLSRADLRALTWKEVDLDASGPTHRAVVRRRGAGGPPGGGGRLPPVREMSGMVQRVGFHPQGMGPVRPQARRHHPRPSRQPVRDRPFRRAP